MTSRVLSTSIALLAALALSPALHAQAPNTPALDDILTRLQSNLDHYDHDVPSFFCDEHVISQVRPAAPDQDTVTDSTFRLKRTTDPGHTTTLVESRQIRSINGKPPPSPDIKGPTLLSGAFEGALAVISLSQKSCMHYELQPSRSRHKPAPIIIRFTTALTPQNNAGCLLEEKSEGRAFIDPASMQITHLELTTPHHVIVPAVPNNPYEPSVIGKRIVTVDYAPVLLGGDTFWMPSSITSRDTNGSGFHLTVWSFRATYRNYHRLEVKSRILPGTDVLAH